MKWTFIIQQKTKAAILLVGIMCLIALTNLMERRNIDNINRSFSSIYYDRLIPATDIFFLTEHLYNKRILMEHFLLSENVASADSVKEKLSFHNTSISQLIEKFSKTYLVENESEALDNFKRRVEHYNQLENRIFAVLETQPKNEALALYEAEGKGDLLLTINHLEDLTKIQSTVGQQLIHDSRSAISSSRILMSLQIAIAILIGLGVQALIMASTLVNKNNTNLNLN